MSPTMAEMVFADAVKREQRHAEFRTRLYQRAADLHNAYVHDCIDKGVDLDADFDPGALWNAAMGAAREELVPTFSTLPTMSFGTAVRMGELFSAVRALPDYRRPE